MQTILLLYYIRYIFLILDSNLLLLFLSSIHCSFVRYSKKREDRRLVHSSRREGRRDPREGPQGQGVWVETRQLLGDWQLRLRHHWTHRFGYPIRSEHWYLRHELLRCLGPSWWVYKHSFLPPPSFYSLLLIWCKLVFVGISVKNNEHRKNCFLKAISDH